MPRAAVADLNQQTRSSANSFPGFEGATDPPVPGTLCYGCSASMLAFASLTSLCSGQIASCPNRHATCLRSRRRYLRHPCLGMTAFSLGDPSAINRRTARWHFQCVITYFMHCYFMHFAWPEILFLAWRTRAYPSELRLRVAAPPYEPDWPTHRRSRLVSHYSVSRLLRETLKGYIEGGSSQHQAMRCAARGMPAVAAVRRCCRRPRSVRCR